MLNKFNHGEIKYYRSLHKARQRQMGENPVTYEAFRNRLKKGMLLKEAIYTPSNTNMARYNMKPKKFRNWRHRFISFFK